MESEGDNIDLRRLGTLAENFTVGARWVPGSIFKEGGKRGVRAAGSLFVVVNVNVNEFSTPLPTVAS